MMRGTYIGPIKHLCGKTALLRLLPEYEFVLAQFDDRSLRLSTAEPFDFEPPHVIALPNDALGFGWYRFYAIAFRICIREAVLQEQPL